MAAPAAQPWKQAVASCQKPVLRRSLWQVVNTLVPYFILWGLMIWTLGVSYWLTFVMALLAAGFMARTFMIFHDCGHGSFFKLQRANHLLGFITGVLTLTPYHQWRHKHALHHATSSDLDRRGTGDVWTMTVREYLEASRWKRIAYRLFRNPVVLFLLAPTYLFLIHQRFPSRGVGKRERSSVYWTNGALLAIATLTSLMIGVVEYLLLQITVVMIAGSIGIWLFYVQHQFDGVYWERGENWEFAQAALKGSSYYKLPRILQWFTGNIGFHHIHHLSPAIPNYNLEKCHSGDPMFQQVKAVTFRSSLKAISFRLWDEESRRLVGFGRLRTAGLSKSIGSKPFTPPERTLARYTSEKTRPGSHGDSSCVNS